MFDRKAYMLIYNKKHYEKNSESAKERVKKWATDNQEKVKEKRKLWWKLKGKKYRADNIEKIRSNARRYIAKNTTKKKLLDRKNVDPNFRLQHILRARVGHAIKRQYGKKAFTTIELLGCTIEEARTHLEILFKDGMTWDNHGTWHIDHIHPLSKFDLTNPNEQKKAFHYTNLQPLFSAENIRKGNRVIV